MGRSRGEDLHKPDFSGGVGRAWEIEKIDDEVNNPALLGGWLIEAPLFAPLWNYHIGLLIHLRDEPYTVPPVIERPGASYEYTLYSLDPKYEDTYDPRNMESLDHIMFPADIEEQLIFPSDNRALYVARLAIQKCVHGALMPDKVYENDWRAFFKVHEDE